MDSISEKQPPPAQNRSAHPPRFELVPVPSGVLSLRSLDHAETFHPGLGPIAEARLLHVAQHGLPARASSHSAARPFVVWDIGLGAAANALAVIEACPAFPVALHSFDSTLDPLHFALRHARELEYPLPWLDLLQTLSQTHFATHGSLTWHLHLADFRDPATPAAAPPPHAVIFDPYSPAANPGMWTPEVFAAILRRVEPGCLCAFTTYSRSTLTRVNLLRAGWFVGCGLPTGEKNETTVAASTLQALRDPLRSGWLDRVRRSAAFPTPAAAAQAAATLAAHPQFASSAPEPR